MHSTCEEVLKMNPENNKAIYRNALSLYEMDEYEKALS